MKKKYSYFFLLLFIPLFLILYPDYESYTWWTKPIVNDDLLTYVSSDGILKIKDTNTNKEYKIDEIKPDDHNNGALLDYKDGYIIFYTGHNENNIINYKILDKKLNIIKENKIKINNKITYIKAYKINENNFQIFYRSNLYSWDILYLNLEDEKVENYNLFMAPEQIYINTFMLEDKIRFVIQGHPSKSQIKGLYEGFIDFEGNLYDGDKNLLKNIKEDKKLSYDDYKNIYESDNRVRLLDINENGILFCEIINKVCKYTYYDGSPKIIGETKTLIDRDNYYYGGAIFNNNDVIYISDNKIYKNNKLLYESSKMIHRPILVNNNIYVLEGDYNSYTDFKTRLKRVN